jgi:uncharacterized protein (TIGR02757 family)
MPNDLGQRLEALRLRWHRPDLLGTDPLILAYEVPPEDRETAAFLASCLALGRASLVVQAGRDLLARIGTPLTARLKDGVGTWLAALEGFGYRFFSAARVANLLDALGAVLRRYDTLEAAWASTDQTGWSALAAFAALFRNGADLGILVPVEGSSGANKRLNLFLRWMVRSDGIDLGLWSCLPASDLFMPIDTHVLQWARAEGLTSRKTADRITCLDVTAALRRLAPDDPLRWDFAITRAGMDAKNTL